MPQPLSLPIVSNAKVSLATIKGEGIRRFIVDSGAAVDVINPSAISESELLTRAPFTDKEIEFTTAAGKAHPEATVSVEMAELDGRVSSAFVFKDSPNLISLGRLCQLEGYRFEWPRSAFRAFGPLRAAKHPCLCTISCPT